MSKGTIVYIGNFELPDKNAAAHRVLNNAKILKHIGYKVVFIDRSSSINVEKGIKVPRENVENFECWRRSFPKGKKQVLKTMYDIKIEKRIIEQYNDVKLVIAYNYPAIALNKLYKLCKKKNIKIIGDTTEWYGVGDKKGVSKLIKIIDTYLRMEKINKRLDGQIVISEFLNNYYKKNENHTICLPPLVDIREEKWKNNHYTKSKICNFIYAGSPSSEKERLDIIIDTFLRLEDKYNIKLNIIGITKAQFINMYNNYNINDVKKFDSRITFFGRLSHKESLEYVKRADYSLIIRDDNRLTKAGFPTKFTESISCGTAVISTDNSDLKKYIVNGNNGYIVSKESFTSDINYILDCNSTLIFDNTIFDYRNYISQTEEFIGKLLGD